MGHRVQAGDEERDGDEAAGQRTTEETDSSSQEPLQDAFVLLNPGGEVSDERGESSEPR